MSKILTICGFVFLTIATSFACGSTFDAAADFSATNNPNGVWSYGWSQTLGGSFVLDTATSTFRGLELWNGNQPNPDSGGTPLVLLNPTADPVQAFGTLAGTVLVEPGQMVLHPGFSGQDADVRFTASSSGIYDLSASFAGADFVGPTTTDVHVLVNGVSIFDGSVNAFGSGPSFSTITTLSAGSTIDFAVGFGSDGGYNFDSTALSALVTIIPEPSTSLLAMCGVALYGVGKLCRRRINWLPA